MLNLDDLRPHVHHEGGVSRRLLLAYAATLAALPSRVLARSGVVVRRPRFSANPFSLGVASGDPTPGGVVLWTKLAPNPLQPGGGMPEEVVEVRWQIAEDEDMRRTIRGGHALATPQLGHSVHVELDGLEPGRPYWYRFSVGNEESVVGCTRTAPRVGDRVGRLRFAFASCQNWEHGFFTAYRAMAEDELDLVLHLGDYIYEKVGKGEKVRAHLGPKLASLADYRLRHAQYRSDPLLRGMHARCPWIVTWDDHEVENNYANSISELAEADPVEFLQLRAAAYQAYYEMMPLRSNAVPQGPDMQLYRTLGWGRLASFQVLDTRQFRTDQPNGDGLKPLDAAALEARNTILGATQRAWLQGALLRSQARWNVLAQQVMMAMVDLKAGEERLYSMDKWTGYARERMDLVRWMANTRIPNPVVLTGDIHSSWVNDLRVDDRAPDGPVVATEFVGTSIASGGDGVERPIGLDALRAENPCVRFHDRQRGYVRCSVTPETWRTDFVVVDKVSVPDGKARVKGTFVLESGRPGAKPG